MRNVATLSGPRETEKRILWPRSSMRGRAHFKRFSMKGSNPSVAGFGSFTSLICASLVMIFSANGNSLAGKMQRAPKADGSVHMPNSDQKPGRNITSGKVSIALRLASNHSVSLEKYSAMLMPHQFGSHGESMMKPIGGRLFFSQRI